MITSVQDLLYVRNRLRRKIGAGTYSVLDALSRIRHGKSFYELLESSPSEALRLASRLNTYVVILIEKSLSMQRSRRSSQKVSEKAIYSSR